MLTISEYAHLAGHIYQPNPTQSYFGLQVDIQSAEQIIQRTRSLPEKWLGVDNITPWINAANPFFARLYLKVEAGRAVNAVVAYRGTEIFQLRNDQSDLRLIEKDLPYGYCDAIFYYNAAQDFVDQHFGSLNLKCTGHSLGGALAQLTGIHKASRTVAFNSPGVGLLPGVDSAVNDDYYKMLVLNINAKAGCINKTGKLIGDEIKVDIDAPKTIQGALTPEILREHFIANLIIAIGNEPKLSQAAY